ncbi:MAG TPA: ACP phosphodiesterase [Cellvibrio sp.]|nr:ACP phosphodiesterase [Cellvibrio sp.]
MNWLAHAFLSRTNVEYRVGNILPDLVSITVLKEFSPPFQEGIRCHREIDKFTDAHPIVKKGMQRLPANYKRYGGILTDVFYDHFLAKNWQYYSSISLSNFTKQFHADLKRIERDIPADIFKKFQSILEHKIFEAYENVSGIEIALQRIDLRLRHPANLSGAITVLENYYSDYESEFSEFFSELQYHVRPLLSD